MNILCAHLQRLWPCSANTQNPGQKGFTHSISGYLHIAWTISTFHWASFLARRLIPRARRPYDSFARRCQRRRRRSRPPPLYLPSPWAVSHHFLTVRQQVSLPIQPFTQVTRVSGGSRRGAPLFPIGKCHQLTFPGLFLAVSLVPPAIYYVCSV